MSNVEGEGLPEQRHPDPLVPAVQDLLLVPVTPGLRPHAGVRVGREAGQCEGGVGPAIRIEDAACHALKCLSMVYYVL